MLIAIMQHIDFKDYEDLGTFTKHHTARLVDEPDGTGSKTSYSSGDIFIEISRTPTRIVVHYTNETEGQEEFIEFLIIPSANLYTIKVNDNYPTFKMFDHPFPILELCQSCSSN